MYLIKFVHFGKEAAILCEHDVRPPLFLKSQVKVYVTSGPSILKYK